MMGDETAAPMDFDALPVLPLRDIVPFPDTVLPLAVGQERSVKLIDDVLAGNRTLLLVASRDEEKENPGSHEVYEVGVVATVARMLKVPDGTLRVLVQGMYRAHIDEWKQEDPYLVARVSQLDDTVKSNAKLLALERNVQQTFSKIVEHVPYLPEELQLAIANVEGPVSLSNLIASTLRLQIGEKQELLEELDVTKRLRRLTGILARELEIISIGTKIQSEVQSELDQTQREYLLRRQLKAIQEELGEFDESTAQANELRDQLTALTLPDVVRRQVDRELRRLENLPTAAAEHGVVRTYLEWIASLPWNQETQDNLDLDHAHTVLDADHYGLERVKDRILEFLAVRALKPDAHGSILCFVGPPGVGKTSLGRSVARALNRNFERISAGGVRDEAEIRGHRRTYIGAMPGTPIRALRDAGSKNPVVLIDEIDKVGSDFRGDPASALLEVLDSEQNIDFRDHYLDVPFDLSAVMFIATANQLETIPPALLDRVEVIRIAGYTEAEKLQIAKRYLLPRQTKRHGLQRSQLRLSDAALKVIVEEYTREAGVRELERKLAALARKVARQVAGQQGHGGSLSRTKVRSLLGPSTVRSQGRTKKLAVGVATGLAWTAAGGEVLFVEATAMPGSGKLTLTGQLGDVMRESAQTALSYIRSNANVYAGELDSEWFAKHDLHVHVPAGAIPKDGPSAGVTVVTALVSLLSGVSVRRDVAMTGEVTLTGQVLPIGGLKEKALAAQRFGVQTVIAPAQNESDLVEFPAELTDALDFVFAENIQAVICAAFSGKERAVTQ